MRVGINAHLLAFTSNYRQAGLSRYIHELVTHVPALDPQSVFIAFVGSGAVPDEFKLAQPRNLTLARSKFPTAKALVRIIWEQAVLPIAEAASKLDLLHCPVNVRPVISPCPVIITVHDLIFLRHPEAFHPAKKTYLRYMTAWSARHAAHLIAVSETTRRDVIELLGVRPDRVSTIHNGVGPQFQLIATQDVADFARKKRLPDGGRTILYVGTLEPRKNIVTLLRAFKVLATRPGYEDTTLLIGGSKGWYYDEIFAVAEELGLTSSGRVRFLDRVPDEELPLWYNVANVFVYPSLYEGFGLPPLEAMACGTPVVVSDRSSLPEVVGEAGIQVRADDVGGWAEAMARLLDDEELAELLSDQGRARARQFTWQKNAQATLDVYRQVYANRKGRGQRNNLA